MAARHGAPIEPVPVLFAGLLESTGLLGPAEVPIKARWMWRNNLRKAARLGLPLSAAALPSLQSAAGAAHLVAADARGGRGRD